MFIGGLLPYIWRVQQISYCCQVMNFSILVWMDCAPGYSPWPVFDSQVSCSLVSLLVLFLSSAFKGFLLLSLNFFSSASLGFLVIDNEKFAYMFCVIQEPTVTITQPFSLTILFTSASINFVQVCCPLSVFPSFKVMLV